MRKIWASTSASPASDFLRATEWRSRSTAFGLIAYTLRLVARRHATSRPASGLDRHQDRVLDAVTSVGEQLH